MSVSGQVIDFNNTEIAFKSVSTPDLIKAKVIFQTFGNQFLATKGPRLLKWALEKHFPISPVVRYTIFNQFCGGVTVDDCMSRVKELGAKGIGSILDYSAEGLGRDEDFEESFLEILRVIKYAAQEKAIPFIVFKVTGLGPFELLEKMSESKSLSAADEKIAKELRRRVFEICSAAAKSNVRVLIDAEESWIQNAIDDIAFEMMSIFNKEKPIIYNTVQMYRHDRLAFLQRTHKDLQGKNCITAFKVVRGAYMEKERQRAKDLGYQDPIQPDKAATDRDFNAALSYSLEHIESMALFAGTHNESSTRYLIELISKFKLANSHSRIEFSQLLGMSDNLSFNLAHAGYNVSKYMPYGPVKSVMPYLIRRAEENTSIKGQAGRELTLINAELIRRAKK
jgi:proline dehydrogenase